MRLENKIALISAPAIASPIRCNASPSRASTRPMIRLRTVETTTKATISSRKKKNRRKLFPLVIRHECASAASGLRI